MASRLTFDDFRADLERDPDVAEQQAELQPSRDVALLLAGLRQRLNLTQSELARRAGVSQAYISQLESGTANPSVRKLNHLLRSAGASLQLAANLPSARSIECGIAAVLGERAEREDLSEAELSHIALVAEALRAAVERRRTAGEPLTKEQIVRQIEAIYAQDATARITSAAGG